MIEIFNRAKILLLPCVLLLTVTLPHLNQGDFRRDTGRYAALGLRMWTEGPLLMPYLDPETPYFNKPPLALWIHGLFLKVLGVRVAIARVPSVLAAVGVVCLSVLTARRIGSRAEALASGCVLALTYEFFRRTREISLDFWQLFFVMLATYLVVSGAKSARRGLVVAAGIPLGLALLCKPFVALGIIPIWAVWLALWGRGRWIAWLLVVALPLGLLVAAPWHIYMWSIFGDAFLQRYLFSEVVERTRGHLQHGPVYYHSMVLFTTYWPWMAFVIFEGWRRWRGGIYRGRKRDLAMFGGVWCGMVLVFLSLFPDKKINYGLPLYPMLSWIAAAGLCRMPWRRLRNWYRSGLTGLAPTAVALLVVLSLAPIQFQKPENAEWQGLFRWMEREGIGPDRLRYSDLEPNQLCYFYLKRGQWLKRYQAVSTHPGADQPGLFVVSSGASVNLGAGSLTVFQSGDLRVTAIPSGP